MPIEKLDEWWKPTTDSIAIADKRSETTESDFKERKSIIKEVLDSDNAGKIIKAADKVDRNTCCGF